MTYKIQINDLVRDATPEEVATIESQLAEAVEQDAVIEVQFAAKESAKAKLAALGLTEDEVNAIIGGI